MQLFDLAQAWVCREDFGVECGGDAVQAFQQSVCRGVEIFVWNAEDATLLCGAQMLPVALSQDALERDAVTSAAPGKEQHIGIRGCDGFRCGGLARLTNKDSTRGLDEFLHPGLGSNQWLAPFFAIDAWMHGDCSRTQTDLTNAALHGCGQFRALLRCMNESREQANVVKNIGECVRSECKHRAAGLENFRQGFQTVGHGGQHQIGADGENFLHGRRPGVGEDGDIFLCKLG